MRNRTFVVAIVISFIAFVFIVGMFQGVSLSHPDYLRRVFAKEHIARSILFAIFAAGIAGLAYGVKARVAAAPSETLQLSWDRGPYLAVAIGLLYVIFVETGGTVRAALGFAPPVTYFGLAFDMVLWNAVSVLMASIALWLLLRQLRSRLLAMERSLVIAPTVAWFLMLLLMAMHGSVSDGVYVVANASVAIGGVWLASGPLTASSNEHGHGSPK